jgi:transcriptional regulator GlxA family with amidase domain
MFRQLYGQTAVAYLRDLRTGRALELLDSTSLGIDDVAARVGMTRSSLLRAVRRELGKCPSKARRLAAAS